MHLHVDLPEDIAQAMIADGQDLTRAAEQSIALEGYRSGRFALLEGLEGKADLDHNGVITASELGAYVSPVVASFSRQTPAMGNLIGSEGGEFVFELQPEALTPMTQQLDGKSLALTQQLVSLEREVADKQAELLRLQESIQAETGKPGRPAAAPTGAQIAAVASPASAAAAPLPARARANAQEKAVALKPGDPVLLNNLGFIYYEMGRYGDAVAYLEKTLAADPKRKEAHGNIACAYLKLGRRADAKTHFERYPELFPASPKAAEVRGILATREPWE